MSKQRYWRLYDDWQVDLGSICAIKRDLRNYAVVIVLERTEITLMGAELYEKFTSDWSKYLSEKLDHDPLDEVW